MKDISADRSIRNVQVHHRHPHAASHTEASVSRPRRRRGNRRLWLIGLAVVAVAAVLGLLLSALFSGASVSVQPRVAQVTLPATIQAALNAPVGTLAYQELSVSLSATTTVPAKGTKQVQRQASGVITIQNNYSSASQRLIANTRFQAPDGKIYRIHDSVVVPGVSGGKAGEASITAYADSPGPDYNRSGTTVYTIPGFKGDPRYNKITAVSGPMTGGFVGNQPSVEQSDLTAAKTEMEKQLDAAVRQGFAGNIPQGFQLIGGTLNVAFGTLAQTDAGNNTAALSETATASGYVVSTIDLASAIARQTVQGYQGEAVTFAGNPATVSASTTGQASSLQLQLGGGQATLVWLFDPNALKTALVGKEKSQFEGIIRQFQPAIQKADASLRPFWTSTFPDNPDKISIKVAGSK